MRAPPAIAALVLFSVVGCGPGTDCVCDIAGLIELDVTTVHVTDEAAWLTTDAQWRPCCGELHEARRAFRVDAHSGASQRVARVPGDASLLIDDGRGPYTVRFAALGTELTLERHVHTLLSPQPLIVGQWRNADTQADVRLDVFTSSEAALLPAPSDAAP